MIGTAKSQTLNKATKNNIKFATINNCDETTSIKPNMEVKIYSSESYIRKPKTIIREMRKDLLKGRELAWRLTLRDIRSQYRQSILGVIWAFILPVSTTLVWIFLNGTGIVKIADTGIPYPAYVFSGTMLWAIFIDSVQSPIQRTTAAKGMLAKINFPKESIILSGIYQVIFNGGIKVALMIIALAFFGVYPSWTILLFPFAFVSLILIGTSIGLLLTPIGMLYTDISRAITLLFQLVMYVTPVIFPMPQSGWVEKLFLINPFTPVILTSRNLITGGELNHLFSFAYINIFFLVLLFIGWLFYRAAMPVLVERMSS